MYNFATYTYLYPIGISQYIIDHLTPYDYYLVTVSDKYLLGHISMTIAKPL